MRPRCGFRWHTKTSGDGGSTQDWDASTQWHVCIRPPGVHVQADGSPPLHMCDQGHTTVQEQPAETGAA
jgi:hypothetical protein